MAVNNTTKNGFKRCCKGDNCQHPNGPYLPLSEFHNNKNHKDGKVYNCKACNKKYRVDNQSRISKKTREWQRANPEKQRGYVRKYAAKNHIKTKDSKQAEEYRKSRRDYWEKYRARNPEKVKERGRRYREKYKDSIREAAKAYRVANRGKRKKKKKEDPEKRRVRDKRYRETYPYKARAKKHRRRARKHNLPARFTAEDEKRAINYFNGRCAVCERQLNDLFGEHTASMDHWVPLSDPRLDNPGTVPTNMIPLCHGIGGCNNKKSNRDPDEWLIAEFGKRKAHEITKRIQDYFDYIEHQ